MFNSDPSQIRSLFHAAGSAWRQNVTAVETDSSVQPNSNTRLAHRFHHLMLGLIIVLQIAGLIDARTHVFYGFDIQSFFVPAHYALYGGWLAVWILLVAYAGRQIRRGAKAAEWLPPRYGLAALGALLFGLAGALDVIWHTLLGFELNLEVLLSPAHLVLFSAFGLIYFSVLSHALYQYRRSPREHQSSLKASLPLLIGIASLFHIVFWPAWYFDPLAADYASQGALVGVRDAYNFIDYGSPTAEIAGVGGILLTTLVLVPFVVLPLYRWRLPSGSLTFIFAWVYLQRTVIVGVYSYLPAVLGAALVGELIWAWICRGGEARLGSPLGYRLLAFCVPLALFSLYFLIVAFMPHGVIWPVHLWAGSIWVAAVAGVLLSFAMIPGTSGVAEPVHT
jgi:hypothetical protein